MQLRKESLKNTQAWRDSIPVTLTLGTRGFSRVGRELSVLAEGRHIRSWAEAGRKTFRAGHYKDLTETGNCARKVSGTQGMRHWDSATNWELVIASRWLAYSN